jgi:GNAT superfamily N-acetyltransferase
MAAFDAAIHAFLRFLMQIRIAAPSDHQAIWRILEPVIRAGETYALPRDMVEADALAYWTGPQKETFVVEADGGICGTYFIRPNNQGGGAHVANCGYVTAPGAHGRGVARAMCAHSLQHARGLGFRAIQFNFVIATNERAVRLWEHFGFVTLTRLPAAFLHPSFGYVDALVMFLAL